MPSSLIPRIATTWTQNRIERLLILLQDTLRVSKLDVDEANLLDPPTRNELEWMIAASLGDAALKNPHPLVTGIRREFLLTDTILDRATHWRRRLRYRYGPVLDTCLVTQTYDYDAGQWAVDVKMTSLRDAQFEEALRAHPPSDANSYFYPARWGMVDPR